MTSTEIADRIDRQLIEMKKTKVWFSEQSGISRATLYLWRIGKAFPTKENLEKVKNTIGLEFAVFEVINGNPVPMDGDGMSPARREMLKELDGMTEEEIFHLLDVIRAVKGK